MEQGTSREILSVQGQEPTCLYYVLQETYPNTPPVWFSESEDAMVASGLGCLAETSGLDNHLLHQVKLLVKRLCGLFSVPVPPEMAHAHAAAGRCEELAGASAPSSSSASSSLNNQKKGTVNLSDYKET